MPKRYLGNIITDTPTEPSDNYVNGAASGVWSLSEALFYTKANLWPNQSNQLPRAVFLAGDNSPSGRVNTIDYIEILTTGNATDFGDLSFAAEGNAACSSSTRGVSGLFNQDGVGQVNVMEYVTIATTSNATDFGDLTLARRQGASASSSTRGLFMGGNSASNVIDYITIASTGNATDFGDIISNARSETAACSSPTRAICSGENLNDIWYVTIASTGNSTDFGDRTVTNNLIAACASETRGVFAGGEQSASRNVIDYVTIASTGNATDFGDLQMALAAAIYGTSGGGRGVFAGGDSSRDTIEYITISSTGNATDFGNLSVGRKNGGACSNAHGGLAA